MKKRDLLILGITAIAACTLFVYMSHRKRNERMLNIIADEGYETAGDILFPLKSNKDWNSKRNQDTMESFESEMYM